MPALLSLTIAGGQPDPLVGPTAGYGGLLGSFISPIYPTLLLVFALTRRFAAAFRRPTAPSPVPVA